MRIAVVTPYFGEPVELLRTCHVSVTGQTRAGRHILVADGRPQAGVADWDADHIILPHPHGDAGNVARGVGAMAAVGEGYDAVAYLDADNWYRSDHLATLSELMESSGAQVCSSTRSLHADDGTLLAPIDPGSDGLRHVDTNTLLIHRRASDLLAFWCEMPHALAAVGDRLMLAAARARGHMVAHSPAPTVAYRTRWAYHYRKLGMPPPPGVKQDETTLHRSMVAWRAMAPAARRRLLRGA